ncbi:MotA/TolQ/ExbB proton channel family protein [Tenacibaculum caenipelagi]|uniref:MotA/TolQ/ExbB proton channel family protein n=1 Tax=Tenacibaculum caenipelagi TaxID=1325435 RepID=A0A4R6TDI9_9FLAO|nr:MotA/TolQ/ExbB proton channel family protein [Tenacibaculum caenipelagi]TDQ22860.1 MotA/TolQ/ExbB proton channel family protein [Tenacibaculum caenipelagi]
MNFIIEGGWMFMVPLVVLLGVVIVLFFFGLKNNTEKNSKLIKSISLFSFVFGVLGFVIGMLAALGAIANTNNNIPPQILAGGLKVGLIAPTFGLIIFLLGRLFDIILLWKREG